MRQAGRYLPEYRAIRASVGNFLDMCYQPDIATAVTLQPVHRFGVDAAILFADILLVPDAMGLDVAFKVGEGPVLDRVRNVRDIRRLSVDGVIEHLHPVCETVRRLSEELPPQVALIGFAGAPWTVATYMVEGGTSRDFVYAKSWAYGAPKSFQFLIDLLIEATVEYLRAQAEAGAEVLQLFDTWAGALNPSGFERWVIEPTRRVVDAVKQAYPEVPIIGFPRGAGVAYRDYAYATGVDVVGIDSAVPLSWAAEVLQSSVAVQGNLDPIALMVGGDAMLQGAGEILSELAHGPFVFNLGHGILPATPPEHVAELVELVRGWRPKLN